MKILFFGDSNTYGFNPSNFKRYTSSERFTAIIKSKLVHDEIIEGGRNGRTTNIDDPYTEGLNGYHSLKSMMKSYKSLDILFIMLGTNDVKSYLNRSIEDISQGIKDCIQIASEKTKDIVLVVPAHINELVNDVAFDLNSAKKSIELSKLYEQIAIDKKIHFLDINEFVQVSELDDVHLSVHSHLILSEVFMKKIEEIRNEKN